MPAWKVKLDGGKSGSLDGDIRATAIYEDDEGVPLFSHSNPIKNNKTSIDAFIADAKTAKDEQQTADTGISSLITSIETKLNS